MKKIVVMFSRAYSVEVEVPDCDDPLIYSPTDPIVVRATEMVINRDPLVNEGRLLFDGYEIVPAQPYRRREAGADCHD